MKNEKQKSSIFSDTATFYGGPKGIRRAASGKPSTGRFSIPPFRIHKNAIKNKKNCNIQITVLIYGSDEWIRTADLTGMNRLL